MDAMNAMPPDATTENTPASERVGESKTLEELFEASQPKLVSDDVQPPKPTRLSEVDRLKLENISLKLLNIGNQFEKLTAARAGFSRQFDELRKACIERYGIDITTTRIDEEGNFLQPGLPPAQGRMVDPGMKVQA
jgi:hypothetical protein